MADKLLEVRNLKKYFGTRAGQLHAVDDISFSMERGTTLGVVGESGCGKSTLGRVILGLTKATSGEVLFEGKPTANLTTKERKPYCKEMQIIFQDPFSSLNPRMTVFETIAEQYKVFRAYAGKEDLKDKVFEMMDLAGIAPRFAFSYPHEMDGGRRQRIGIARALAMDPKFIVCDEPVSALDVSIQAQILNLLQDLQKEKNLTYIFITHDLSVVKHISDQIMVMYLGKMVEYSDTRDLFTKQYHPYTKGLLSAIPIPSINVEKKKILLRGELSSPVNPKPGCRFANRCDCCTKQCTTTDPVLEEASPGHYVACHNYREINNL